MVSPPTEYPAIEFISYLFNLFAPPCTFYLELIIDFDFIDPIREFNPEYCLSIWQSISLPVISSYIN